MMNSSLMWPYFIVNVTCLIYLEVLFAAFCQFQTNSRVLLGHCFLLPQFHLFEVICLICSMQDHWFRHSERASCPTLYQDLSWLLVHIKALDSNQWLLSFTRNGCFGSLSAFEADQERLHQIVQHGPVLKNKAAKIHIHRSIILVKQMHYRELWHSFQCFAFRQLAEIDLALLVCLYRY